MIIALCIFYQKMIYMFTYIYNCWKLFPFIMWPMKIASMLAYKKLMLRRFAGIFKQYLITRDRGQNYGDSSYLILINKL